MQPFDSAPQHPVDQLIARLVYEDAEASPDDLQLIVDRMATAPFNRHPTRVLSRDRGMVYGDIVLGRMADSLELHLVKRVVEEEQWAVGTTAAEYLADLRTAARHPRARILAYERTTDYVAATISPTVEVVPGRRLGSRPLPHLLVVYSALHGVIRTGYMYSDFSELDMPEAVRWLR